MPSILAQPIPASAHPAHCRGPPPDRSPGCQSCQEHSLALVFPRKLGQKEQNRAGAGKVLGAGTADLKSRVERRVVVGLGSLTLQIRLRELPCLSHSSLAALTEMSEP